MSTERELTLRALLTGILLGAILTPSNVYSGLRIGWSFNMSIISLLLAFGFWRLYSRQRQEAAWTLRESNICQTTASAAASIISGGLVAPIPAYTLISGQQIDAVPLMAWVFSVSFLGVWVAWYLRGPLLDSGLRFPEGMATLETMQDIFRHGGEAIKRIAVLFSAALASGTLKWIDDFVWHLPRWTPGVYLERLTFTLDPSLLLIGFGGIIGLRVGLSLLLGAVLAWGGLGSWLLDSGHIVLLPDSHGPQFKALVEWLLWPGVSLMVSATLANLLARYLVRLRRGEANNPSIGLPPRPSGIPLVGMLASSALVVTLQILLFDIDPLMAVLTLPLAMLLALVAARVVGETAISPIGAVGKLSQLSFGLIAPGQPTLNLMSANTAGGAAGQCADLMNDFKVGRAIGTTPERQLFAQCVGIFIGSIVGVLAYQLLIPDPQGMLLTEQWPAPAVATWKAVAEALTQGLDSVAPSARWAMLAALLSGSLIGVGEGLLPPERSRYLPSCAAVGLAFVIPASLSVMMASGALLAWLWMSRWRSFAERFVITLAAGLVAGESFVGVGASLWQILRH
ncbi:OPT family oligopeptide transporter [Azomonas macrocytogenes]|uniref:Putative oligopeptide transporter (OPT) family protein n=1 Tax=Azomonas macrocytogenes TaxID=69962 RepID=A0A839T4W3_AZOMA|nr:OPT family oligopeptide transporter [Azomonas macrocytogenes]MBB3103354.1 putative oligopeptide transporter (OPT) family protein [Azomonas macrocytogenes]